MFCVFLLNNRLILQNYIFVSRPSSNDFSLTHSCLICFCFFFIFLFLLLIHIIVLRNVVFFFINFTGFVLCIGSKGSTTKTTNVWQFACRWRLSSIVHRTNGFFVYSTKKLLTFYIEMFCFIPYQSKWNHWVKHREACGLWFTQRILSNQIGWNKNEKCVYKKYGEKKYFILREMCYCCCGCQYYNGQKSLKITMA